LVSIFPADTDLFFSKPHCDYTAPRLGAGADRKI
jgi:hypothetical protein